MGAIPVIPSFPAGKPVQGTVLEELCTALTWCFTGRPLCLLQQTGTAQSIPGATIRAVTWTTKIVDRDSGWNGANEYIANTPGIYMVAASVPYASSSTGDRETCFQVTTGSNNPQGSGISASFGYTSIAANGNASRCAKFLTPYLYDGDFIEVLTYQDSGGTLSLITGGEPGPPWFSITLVSG